MASAKRDSKSSSLEQLFGLQDSEQLEESAPTWRSQFIPHNMAGSSPIHPKDVSERAVYKFVRNPYFRISVNLIILLNAIQMGVAADYKGEHWDVVWEACDHFFTAVFAIEMVLQVVALKIYYWRDPWNYIDFLVAWIAIIDSWILNFVHEGNSGMGALRVFRLLRLLRLLKIMHILPELMMVVNGILASLKAMFWVFMLLLIVLYAASICCVEVIGLDEDVYPAREESTVFIQEELVKSFNSYLYFGTVLRAMISLFNMVLLDEWGAIIRPVFEVQRLMTLFFIILIIICSFGILNVIIGVVVERTTQAMNAVREAQLDLVRNKQMAQVRALANVMFSMDSDHNNRISKEEFEKGADDEELVGMLTGIDFPAGFTFLELFQMLDVDGNESLSKPEFIDGVMRMIYSDHFQRDCLSRCATGQIKETLMQLREENQAFAADLKKDVEKLQVELRTIRHLEQFSVPPVSLYASGEFANPLASSTSEEAPVQYRSTEQEDEIKIADEAYVETSKSWHVSERIWEPLQMSLAPVKLLRVCPQSCRSLTPEGAASLATAATEFARQNIVGFLPVGGCPPDAMTNNRPSGYQHVPNDSQSVEHQQFTASRMDSISKEVAGIECGTASCAGWDTHKEEFVGIRTGLAAAEQRARSMAAGVGSQVILL